MRSAVLCRVDAAKGNCSWGNQQLHAAAQISAETAAVEIKAKLNNSDMTAAPSEILECSAKVLMGRNDTNNTVKMQLLPPTLFSVCYVHVNFESQHIRESHKVVFTD